jgi:hypothetical protein
LQNGAGSIFIPDGGYSSLTIFQQQKLHQFNL